MRRFLRRLAGSRGGGSAIEFALLLAPFLMMLVGVMEFGRLMWTREALQETAAVAARCMGMSASSCASSGAYSSGNTTSFVESTAAKWGLPLSSGNITLNNNATCAGVTAPNAFSSVTLSYTYQTVVPKELLALANGMALSATACFPNN